MIRFKILVLCGTFGNPPQLQEDPDHLTAWWFQWLKTIRLTVIIQKSLKTDSNQPLKDFNLQRIDRTAGKSPNIQSNRLKNRYQLRIMQQNNCERLMTLDENLRLQHL